MIPIKSSLLITSSESKRPLLVRRALPLQSHPQGQRLLPNTSKKFLLILPENESSHWISKQIRLNKIQGAFQLADSSGRRSTIKLICFLLRLMCLLGPLIRAQLRVQIERKWISLSAMLMHSIKATTPRGLAYNRTISIVSTRLISIKHHRIRHVSVTNKVLMILVWQFLKYIFNTYCSSRKRTHQKENGLDSSWFFARGSKQRTN